MKICRRNTTTNWIDFDLVYVWNITTKMEDHLTKIDQETFHITIKFVFTTRLTPVYFFVILFSATLFAKLLDGPRMNDMADYGGKCMFYGVLNLLYLNNIWPPPSVGVSGTNEKDISNLCICLNKHYVCVCVSHPCRLCGLSLKRFGIFHGVISFSNIVPFNCNISVWNWSNVVNI